MRFSRVMLAALGAALVGGVAPLASAEEEAGIVRLPPGAETEAAAAGMPAHGPGTAETTAEAGGATGGGGETGATAGQAAAAAGIAVPAATGAGAGEPTNAVTGMAAEPASAQGAGADESAAKARPGEMQPGDKIDAEAAAAAAEEKRKADALEAKEEKSSILDQPVPVEEPAALPGEATETRI